MSFKNPFTDHLIQRRKLLLGMASAAALPLGTVSCGNAEDGNMLRVGGLPVTCNLTLPIACAAKAAASAAVPAGNAATNAATNASSTAANKSATVGFKYSKYSGFPELKESMMAGRLQAGYLLAPLVMDLVDKRIPLKIVSLGHRSGAVIMVRTDSDYHSFKQMKGKRIAIPSRFAVDFLFLRKMLLQEGMTPDDVEIVEMQPPDMPAALYANGIAAYCTGEPFGVAAEMAGYARPLRMTRDEWPNYICCVLAVREELIQEHPAVVQDLVNHILGAGAWMDQSHANLEKAADIAAGQQFFNQDPQLLRFVMNNPTDRVTYGDLRMIKAEFDELMELSIKAGTLTKRIPYESYADESFFRNAKPTVVTL